MLKCVDIVGVNPHNHPLVHGKTDLPEYLGQSARLQL